MVNVVGYMNMELNAKQRLELALRYLREGKALAEKDPIQASEKLYKATEEVVKSLTTYFNFGDVIKRVDERGRWTATELEKAVLRISEKLGDWFSTRGTRRGPYMSGASTRPSSTPRT